MSRVVIRALNAAMAGAAAVLLSACISLLPETEPDALYRLEPGTAAPVSVSGGGETVIVSRIAAPRGLAGDRIAIQREGRIAYMAGAAWLAPAPEMLQAVVLDALHAEAPAITPARVEDGVTARYTLDLELRSFEADYDAGRGGAPEVEVSLRARLIDRDTRALLAARTVDASRRASANRQGAIVEAFSQASADAAASLADWTQAMVCGSGDAPEACQEAR